MYLYHTYTHFIAVARQRALLSTRYTVQLADMYYSLASLSTTCTRSTRSLHVCTILPVHSYVIVQSLPTSHIGFGGSALDMLIFRISNNLFNFTFEQECAQNLSPEQAYLIFNMLIGGEGL